MSEPNTEFDQLFESALQNEHPVWTPECPEPETLLDWIEQAAAYPQAAQLLDHLMSCAFCRQAYTQMSEIKTSAQVPAAPRRRSGRVTRLSTWADELLTSGLARPVRAVRAALQAMERLMLSSAPASVRSANAPTDLRPAWSAVRTSRPTLRWSAADSSQEYSIVAMRHAGRKTRQPLWEGNSGSERQLTLPEQAGLEPGGIYLWQVVARAASHEVACPPVCFAVLADATRRQLEALEMQTKHGTLEHIGLLEAFGLYDEALQLVETMIDHHPDDARLAAIRAKLL